MIGIKRGGLTPILPEHVREIDDKISTKLLCLLGAWASASIIALSIKSLNLYYPIYLIVVCFIMAILNFVYYCWLGYHMVKHMWKVLKSGELDIRNSPIKRLPSGMGRGYYCARGLLKLGVGLSSGVGVLIGYDAVLMSYGYEAKIVPMLGEYIGPLLPVSDRLLINNVRMRDLIIIEERSLGWECIKALANGDDEYVEILERELAKKELERENLENKIARIRSALISKGIGKK